MIGFQFWRRVARSRDRPRRDGVAVEGGGKARARQATIERDRGAPALSCFDANVLKLRAARVRMQRKNHYQKGVRLHSEGDIVKSCARFTATLAF